MLLRKNPKSISMFLALLMLFFSCQQYDSISDDNQNAFSEITVKISGEDLFRAIFFLQGDLINKIPTLNNI